MHLLSVYLNEVMSIVINCTKIILYEITTVPCFQDPKFIVLHMIDI
jgi:hypothetical protein